MTNYELAIALLDYMQEIAPYEYLEDCPNDDERAKQLIDAVNTAA